MDCRFSVIMRIVAICVTIASFVSLAIFRHARRIRLSIVMGIMGIRSIMAAIAVTMSL